MPFADLHMHSSASDGTCEPAHIAQMAVQTSGLSVIALTDHDSLAGLPPAVAACAENGIEFVPGVEITTRYDAVSYTHLTLPTLVGV